MNNIMLHHLPYLFQVLFYISDSFNETTDFCRSSIEMIPKMRIFCKLDEPKVEAKTADFGVKTQAVLRLKVTYFERQCNLSCKAKQLTLPKKGTSQRVASSHFLTRKPL